jgi:CheY-like chemotaxis protein
MLRKKGFHVVKARNAVEAHEILKGGEKVDLVLLDINMPEVQGEKLYEVIRSFHYKTKVIVCSVFPVEEQGKKIPGAADYYDKSESFAILLQKIDKVLKEGPVKKILIIDDDPQIRSIYRRLLMGAGYYPIDTGDNPESFHFLKTQVKNIDLILLDIAMPRITGLEFYDMIKTEHPQAKVIVSSVFSEEQQKTFIFKADDYFDKSGPHKVLLEKVKCLIGSS